MNCPMQNNRASQLLLDYAAGKLDPASSARLERHLDACAGCREFVRSQRALWDVLDEWTPVDVSPSFDRRLYSSIAREEETRGTFAKWVAAIRARWAPVGWRPVVSLAAACAALVVALLVQPASPRPEVQTDEASQAVERVDMEQVERALEDLEMLRQFSPKV